MEHTNGVDAMLMGEQPSMGMESNDSKDQITRGDAGLPAHVPRCEVKLFAGRIPRSYTEEDVRNLFAPFGDVIDVVIIRDKDSGAHRGAAFVRMGAMAQADAAIRELNNRKVLDESLAAMQVRYARGECERRCMPAEIGEGGSDQAKLFIGSLTKNATEEDVKSIFSPYGTIDEIFLIKDKLSGAGKGCAFVKYRFKEEGLFAISNIDGKITMPGCSRPIEARFAVKDHQKGQNAFPSAAASAPYMPNGFGGPVYPPAMAYQPPSCQPPSWKEYFTTDNPPRAYYHNELSNVTQWERPLELVKPQMGMVAPNAGGSQGTSGGAEVAGPPGANVFIFHYPNEWGQEDLFRAFSPFGTIKSGRVVFDKNSGKHRGFAFVSYDDQQAASNAVLHMNGYMAGGKRLKVSIKKGEENMAVPASVAPAAAGTGPKPQPTPQMGGYGMPGVMPQHVGAYSYVGNRYTPY